jgi:arylsulfatase A-like enzyme
MVGKWHLGEDAKPFPRLPTVKAWEELPEEERALAARDMEVYAAMVDYGWTD